MPRSETSRLAVDSNDEASITTLGRAEPSGSRRWLLRVAPGAAMAIVVLAGLAACGGEDDEDEEEDD